MPYIENNISIKRATYDTSAFNSGAVDEADTLAYSNLFYPYIQDNAGSNIVSLTIDIINNNDNFIQPQTYQQEKWIESDRYANNLLSDRYIWGFKETSHILKRSRAISNAFCFSGQQLTFNITKLGHLAGYIENQFLYCNTSLNISIFDIANAQTYSIGTFSSFEKPVDDSSRIFTWTVPNVNNDAYNQFGLFGCFAIKLTITNKIYTDARKTNQTIYDHSDLVSQNYLQLLTYSAPKEATDVSADTINIFNSLPIDNDTWLQLFNKSIFPDLALTNLNGVSNDQKRAIMADQIAVLFASQHPVVTGEYAPSKIIGFGGEASIPPEKIIQRAITYAEKYDSSIINLVQDRLFGIFASYKTFNLASAIEENFSNNNQSTQTLRDPVKSIIMDQNGIVTDDIGVNGILFNPLSLFNINNQVLITQQNVPPSTLNLYFNTIDIQNIKATRPNGTDLQSGDTYVNISFDLINGASNISKIRYGLTLVNNLTSADYTDLTGLTRSRTFDFSGYGGVFFRSSPFAGDIAKIRIDIEDNDGFINTFYRNQFLPQDYSYPAIVKTKTFQRHDGSGLVDIYYQYQGTSAIDYANVSFQYSLDNSSWSTPSVNNVIGDIGSSVSPGWKRIAWNTKELATTVELVYIKISLVNIDSSVNANYDLVNNVVLDHVIPTVYIRKLSELEQ